MSNILKIVAQSCLIRSHTFSKSLLIGNKISISKISVGYASSYPGNMMNPPLRISRMEIANRKSDRIPESYRMIYRSSLHIYVRYLYPASLFLTIVGFYGVYQSFSNTDKALGKAILKVDRNYYDISEIILTWSFYFLTNIVLLWMCARHPVRIYRNSEKQQYKMVLATWKYPFKKTVTFKTEDIQKKYKNPWNALLQASHLIHRKSYHIISSCFKSPADYYKMMGNNELL